MIGSGLLNRIGQINYEDLDGSGSATLPEIRIFYMDWVVKLIFQCTCQPTRFFVTTICISVLILAVNTRFFRLVIGTSSHLHWKARRELGGGSRHQPDTRTYTHSHQENVKSVKHKKKRIEVQWEKLFPEELGIQRTVYSSGHGHCPAAICRPDPVDKIWELNPAQKMDPRTMNGYISRVTTSVLYSPPELLLANTILPFQVLSQKVTLAFFISFLFI